MNSRAPLRPRLPYPGLRPFRRDEADLFFGRESCTDQMVDRLAATRFLAVLGASGSGKSSLVRTGLFDALELGLLAEAGARWRIADMRPAGSPLAHLARALLVAASRRDTAAPDDAAIARLAEYLRRGPRAVIEWCLGGNLPPRTSLLILADQFEELFRYTDYEGQQDAEKFVALLIESARSREAPIYVVITMRSDFLGPCALIPDLAEAINAGLYLTRRMTREETRQAIEGPARVCGFAIEPALVTRLLNDLASWEGESGLDRLQLLARRADQLPLMQHVLNRLWLRAWTAAGDPGRVVLKDADYVSLGGLGAALSAHADDVLRSIPEADRDVAEPVFRALVDDGGIAAAVRRSRRFGELVALTGGRAASVAAVIEAFRHPDCNFLTLSKPPPLADDTTIDISHESLIRQWKTLADWVHQEAKAAEKYRELEGQAKRWQEAGEPDRRLLTPEDAPEARAWWREARPTQVWASRYSKDAGAGFALTSRFVELSGQRIAREQRRRRDRQRIIAAAAAVTIILLAACVAKFFPAYADSQGDYYASPGANQNSALAMAWYQRAAWFGDPWAQFGIGMLYQTGAAGGTQSNQLAAKWYEEAAAQKYVNAYRPIALLYLNGAGVAQSDAAGLQWFEKSLDPASPAAARAQAQYQIGLLYDNGQSVPKDFGRANLWFQQAASGANPSGQAAYEVGLNDLNGQGVNAGVYTPGQNSKQQNDQAAMTWFQKAAAIPGPDKASAEYQLGKMYMDGDGVPVDDVQAMVWLRKADNDGSVDADVDISDLYYYGEGVKADQAESVVWLQRGANRGSATAESLLGMSYAEAGGVKEDDAKALYWLKAGLAGGTIDPGAVDDEIGEVYTNQGKLQNYKLARDFFLQGAAQGSIAAEANLGDLYLFGEGVSKNYTTAMQWYQQAADGGSAFAENRLGEMYLDAEGVKEDDQLAFQYFQKAVAGGNGAAEFHLANRYFFGTGTKQNYAQALVYFQKSIRDDQGDAASAEYDMGEIYLNGDGVPINYPKAMSLYEEAASAGSADAENRLGEMYLYAEGVKEDDHQAFLDFQKAAAEGSGVAEYHLANRYFSGTGTAQDYGKALTYFEKAVKDDPGDAAEAEYDIGEIYLNGDGVKVDYGKAMSEYKIAAAAGSTDAENRLGEMYLDAEGVKEDDHQAFRYFQQAARGGSGAAEFHLANRYFNGSGVAQDYKQALAYFIKSVKDDPDDAGSAEYDIGEIYRDGDGVPPDAAKAITWFQKAAKDDEAADDPSDAADADDALGMLDLDGGPNLPPNIPAARLAFAQELKDDLAAGTATDPELVSVSWAYLLNNQPAPALTAANKALALAPNDLIAETNKADALMMLGETEAARAIYLKYRDVTDAGNASPWKTDVLGDFATLHKLGHAYPLMTQIKQAFAA